MYVDSIEITIINLQIIYNEQKLGNTMEKGLLLFTFNMYGKR